jgi:hypothetical protein
MDIYSQLDDLLDDYYSYIHYSRFYNTLLCISTHIDIQMINMTQYNILKYNRVDKSKHIRIFREQLWPQLMAVVWHPKNIDRFEGLGID